jgi:hypothetical protein
MANDVEHIAATTFTSHDGRTFKVLVLEPSAAEVAPLVIEPFTWAWLGLKIAEGALSGIGAKLLGDLLDWDKAVSKADLQAMLNDFLHAIAAVVRREIGQNEIEKLLYSAKHVQNMIAMYLHNHNQNLLLPLLFEADEITEQTARFSFRSVSSFAVVGSIELLILQEIYNRSKHKGDKSNIGMRANGLLDYGTKIQPAVDEFNKSRFSGVGTAPTVRIQDFDGVPHPLPTPRQPPTYWYRFEGQLYGASYSSSETERFRQEHIQREYARLEKEILLPFYPIMEKWRQIADANA